MKTRYKIIIVLAFVILLLLLAASILMLIIDRYFAHYETWGENEVWYYHPAGYQVDCQKRMFGPPGPCQAKDEHGVVVATKTEMWIWENVTKWPNLMSDCTNEEWHNSKYPCAIPDNYDEPRCVYPGGGMACGSSYPRDTTGDYDHCFDNPDPEYGVVTQNSTHRLNIKDCEWQEIK